MQVTKLFLASLFVSISILSFSQMIIKPIGGSSGFSNTKYLRMDAANDQYARFLDHDSLDCSMNDGGFTWVFWMKVPPTASNRTPITKDNYNGTSPTDKALWRIQMVLDGELRFNAAFINNVSYLDGYDDDIWHCWALTMTDRGIGTWYRDSTTLFVGATANFNEESYDFDNDRNMLWGGNTSNDGASVTQEFLGDLDNVMLFSRPLTTTELDNFMDLGSTYDNDPAYAPSPYDVVDEEEVSCWWPLGEGSDSMSDKIYDQKTSGSKVNSSAFNNTSGWSFNSH